MQKESHKVDEIIRQQLAEIPSASPGAGGWERLAAELDKDPDSVLRTALVGLAANDDVAGWEALERKIDPTHTGDASIAAGLNALTPTPPEGSWETLSAKIDDAIGRDVDTVVTQRLDQETAGRTSGWSALAARLELISHRRHLVGAWKVTEVSLLLSLLLLFLRFGPETVSEQPTAALSEPGFLITEVTGATNATNPPVNGMELPVALQAIAPDLQEPKVVLVTAPEVKPSEAIALLPPAEPAKLETQRSLAAPLLSLGINDAAYTLLASPDYSAKWEATLPSPALTLPEIDHSLPVQYRLNFFLAPAEINQVITPQSVVSNIDIAGSNRYTNSSSFGALIDINKGNDGLEIGAIYSRHAYTPTELIRPDCLVENNCPEGYDRFIYHSISFPFSYERTLFSKNDWRIGLRGGMAMSVITQSEFQLTEEAREDLEDSLLQPPGRPRSGRSYQQNTISTRQVLDPEPGWFEGGSILANASFYLSSGFTVERSLTPRFSIYVSPTYGRVIYLNDAQGVGPYNDRIHRASLRFGSRFLLGGK